MTKINKLYFTFLILTFTLASCGEGESSNVEHNATSTEKVYAEGQKLMENKCYVCHNPKLKENQLIAPPMVAIKEAYMTDDEGQFIESFINFLSSPDKSKAKLPEAVKKYGLMPYQRYKNDDIKKIAKYMFNNQIEKPNWWEGDGESKEDKPEEFGDNYEEKGLHFAMTTKQVLGQNLMGTIQQKGVLEALEFCNVQAYPLTDSMASHHNAKITRVSDQPRNPNNRANEEDLKIIQQFKKDIKNENDPSSVVVENNQKVAFYHPIITNDKCLLCHGDPKSDIADDVFKSINELYPDDEATGYYANQVRGAWKIIFEK